MNISNKTYIVVKPDESIDPKFFRPCTEGSSPFEILPFLAIEQNLTLLNQILRIQGPSDQVGTAISIKVNDLFVKLG